MDDYSVDLVVVGYGAAGAAATIARHDLGLSGFGRLAAERSARPVPVS